MGKFVWKHEVITPDVLQQITETHQMMVAEGEADPNSYKAHFVGCEIVGIKNFDFHHTCFSACTFVDCEVVNFGHCDISGFGFTNTNVRWAKVPFSYRTAYGEGVFVLRRADGTYQVKAGCFWGSVDDFKRKTSQNYGHRYLVKVLQDDGGFDEQVAHNRLLTEFNRDGVKFDYVRKSPLNLWYNQIVQGLMKDLDHAYS